MAFLNSYRFLPSRSGAALRWLFTGIPLSDLVQQLPTVPQAVVITEFSLELSFLRFKRLLVWFPGREEVSQPCHLFHCENQAWPGAILREDLEGKHEKPSAHTF